jgi:hypothetical protein
LESAVHDASKVIQAEGFTGFERFSDLKELLRTLIEERENIFKGWAMGPNPPAHRHYLTGYIAQALGERELALEHLKTAYEWYRLRNQETYTGSIYSHLLSISPPI